MREQGNPIERILPPKSRLDAVVQLFRADLWRGVNDHFRHSGAFYVDAPRSRAYARKQRRMYRHFPRAAPIHRQAAYLAKNLVNLQRYPDANKRTASVLLEVFLESNGFELVATGDAYAEFLLRVQRDVPSRAWDGRSFSLRKDYIPWLDDEYHGRLEAWFVENAVRKA